MFLCIIMLTLIGASAQDDSTKNQEESIAFADKSSEVMSRYFYSIIDDQVNNGQDKVKIQVYYESLCPGSKIFISTELSPTVIQLGQYLNINLHPYGHANTTEVNGHYEFSCQHGPLECYGNKLHACAIDVLKNMTKAVLFNGCMMAPQDGKRGSNDATADQCSTRMKIDSAPIKTCARGERGSILLKKHGEETKKEHLRYVPYTLINGKEFDLNMDLMSEICAAFTTRPLPCVPKLQFDEIYD